MADRLISADKVAEAIAWLNEYDFVLWHDVMECIDKVSTVDAVRVVRCKDCKYHRNGNKGIPYCSKIDYGYGWNDNDYCSMGERREDAKAD